MLPRLRDLGRKFEDTPDVQEVWRASCLLQIGEFRLFRLAFAEWYGHEPEDRTIEPLFVRYLFRQAAPFWVRHFARRVLELDAEGRLDPRDFGIPRRPLAIENPEDFRRKNQLILIGAALAVFSISVLNLA